MDHLQFLWGDMVLFLLPWTIFLSFHCPALVPSAPLWQLGTGDDCVIVRPELALRCLLGFEDSSRGKEGVSLGVWLGPVLLQQFCFVAT
jgi:hypothetical protein